MYNKDRSFVAEVPMDEEALDNLFGDSLKIYVKAIVKEDGSLEIIQRLKDQPW